MFAYCGNNPVNCIDPQGNVFISALVIGIVVGSAMGFGVTAYVDHKDDGKLFNGSVSTTGYVSNTLVGGSLGAAVTYLAPTIGSSFATASTATLTGRTVAIAASGTAITGALVSSITTKKSNGYWGQKYSNDHSPDHIHLKGPGTDIRIGRDGNPLKGDGPLNSQQRKALKKLWNEFLKLFQM